MESSYSEEQWRTALADLAIAVSRGDRVHVVVRGVWYDVLDMGVYDGDLVVETLWGRVSFEGVPHHLAVHCLLAGRSLEN